jgi:hypothetical protein
MQCPHLESEDCGTVVLDGSCRTLGLMYTPGIPVMRHKLRPSSLLGWVNGVGISRVDQEKMGTEVMDTGRDVTGAFDIPEVLCN